MTAQERLDLALITLAAQGRRPRCGEYGAGELWTSDDLEDRRQAVARCRGCPVLKECGAAADERREKWHVWGGVDRTPPKTRKQTPASPRPIEREIPDA